MILGLDRPTSGTTTVIGRPYAAHTAPLPEAARCWRRSPSTPDGRRTHHLLAMAATTAIPASRVDEVIDLVGLREVPRKRDGGFSLGVSSASACSPRR